LSLEAEDLERLAISAFLTNRDEDCLRALGRAHHAYLDRGKLRAAARVAFWAGFRLAGKGEHGPAAGWFARAQRLLDREGTECVERGYLMLSAVEEQMSAGNWGGAFKTASDAAEIGRRFSDADLTACGLHLQGRACIGRGEVGPGLALLDEAMVAVVADELSPPMAGLVYCSVIMACQQIYALDRAREWTSALGKWCRAQPELVAFTGSCLVHRAEVMQLRGEWQEAIKEVSQVCERFEKGIDPQSPAAAFYQRGEIHRLRGEYAAAEKDYRCANRFGREPQPGLALLRLAQGRKATAAAAIRRVMSATTDPMRRMQLLPAYVEIMLDAGDITEAGHACSELEKISARIGTRMAGALAAQARGAVSLSEGDANAALLTLRFAFQAWQEIEAPYERARARVLIGMACGILGDEDGAEMELTAAQATFEQLGAKLDLARPGALSTGGRLAKLHGLTSREVQVLRLLSSGKTNASIAAELFLSERTIERHLSNIFTKLDLSTRAAATAWAYEHGVI
jgi:DNA-binding CsgD family transcriptional regulator